MVAGYDVRPREERDYKEIYPDLDETSRLAVVVVDSPQAATPCYAQVVATTKPVFVRRETKNAFPARMLKTLIEHGFRAHRPAKALSHRGGRLQASYVRDLQTVNSGKRQVRYDLDEQDELFLGWRNGLARARASVLREMFEVVFTALEDEWHRLEVRMGGMEREKDREGENDAEWDLDESFDKYGSDDGTGFGNGNGALVEQRCAVCNGNEGPAGNAIVFCDGCNIAVHQECYGIAFIPEGQWFCRRCMLVRGGLCECTFCPSRLGAFKQLDNGLWAHVVCALWIPEVYFANPIYMEPVEGVGNVPRTRWKLVCYVCKQRVGACIQCTNRQCFLAYHVTCAKRAGLYMEMEQGVHGALALKASLTSFCHRHCPPDWSAEAAAIGIAKTRRFYRDRLLVSEQRLRMASRRRLEDSTSAFRWRTEHNTPIAPRSFVDVVLEVLLALKADVPEEEQSSLLRGLGHSAHFSRAEILADLRAASADLCKYWCLKREAKRGAPLVRPPAQKLMLVAQAEAAHLYDTGSTREALARLEEKIEFGRTLGRDLEKLIELARCARDRQLLRRRRAELQVASLDVAYFPLCTLAHSLLTWMAEKLDPARVVANFRPKDAGVRNYWDIVERARSLQYRSASEVSADVEALLAPLAALKTGGSVLVRDAAKWLAYWRSHSEELGAAEKGVGKVPFVEIDGAELSVKRWDAREALEEEGLSDVEAPDSGAGDRVGGVGRSGDSSNGDLGSNIENTASSEAGTEAGQNGPDASSSGAGKVDQTDISGHGSAAATPEAGNSRALRQRARNTRAGRVSKPDNVKAASEAAKKADPVIENTANAANADVTVSTSAGVSKAEQRMLRESAKVSEWAAFLDGTKR